MGIQEDIKQTKFRSEYQKALVNIIYTSSWIAEKLRRFLEPHGLTHQQYNVLRILRGSYPNPLSTIEIRSRMLDKMSDVSRIVDRLVAKGLVEKRVSRKDKRLVDIIISQKGKALMSEMDKYLDDMDKIAVNITETEARNLNRILDKMRAI